MALCWRNNQITPSMTLSGKLSSAPGVAAVRLLLCGCAGGCFVDHIIQIRRFSEMSLTEVLRISRRGLASALPPLPPEIGIIPQPEPRTKRWSQSLVTTEFKKKEPLLDTQQLLHINHFPTSSLMDFKCIDE